MAEATTALDAVYRALTWVGYGGLAGALVVLLVVWPEGVRQRRLALVALGGSTLVALAVLGWFAARLALGADPVLPRVEGAAAITRLAVLAAVGGFFTDLLDGPVRGRRRSATAVAVLALTATVLAVAAGGRPGQGAAELTGDVLVATVAVVCGVCVVLAAVVLPGDARPDLPHLRARVAQTAPAGLWAVALAGAVHAIAVARSPSPVLDPPAVLLVLLLLTAALAAVLGLRRLLRTAVLRVASATAEPEAEAAPEQAVRWFPPVEVERRPAIEVYEGPRRSRAAEPPPVVVLPDTAAAREALDESAAVDPRAPAPRRG